MDKNPKPISISIVITFRDWGLGRLKLNLAHLVPQTVALGGEVIVSDYGSKDAQAIAEICEETGAILVRTEDTGPWSKSCGLNAGFAQSRGEYLIATDADMLFAPGSIEGILQRLRADSNSYYILQCRDLPQQYSVDVLASKDLDWSELDTVSKYRPRYGMGGMIAFARDAYLTLRGYDERMSVYGAEDIDFANRLQRFGLALVWIAGNDVRMYHVWHPSSRKASEATVEGKLSVKRNSEILTEDKTYIRNLREWRFAPADAKPVASIVICTRDRSEYLQDAVYSALSQTVRDIEVLVIDDGSSDDTLELLAQIDDSRLRVFQQSAKGIAAARNLGAQKSRSEFTVVFDDDDIMLPTRIEDHFSALVGGIDGTYGGWIDYDNENPSNHKIWPGKDFTEDILLAQGGVYLHPTLMVRTSLIRLAKYDETYRSGSDYNLAIRMLRNGLTLRHYGGVAILRRLHDRQVTHADAAFQTASWSMTKGYGLFGLSKPQYTFIQNTEDVGTKDLGLSSVDISNLVKSFGPTGKSERIVTAELSSKASFSSARTVSMNDGNGLIETKMVELKDPSWKDIWKLSSASNTVIVNHPHGAGEAELPYLESLLGELLNSAFSSKDIAFNRGSRFVGAWAKEETDTKLLAEGPSIQLFDRSFLCVLMESNEPLMIADAADKDDAKSLLILERKEG